MKQLLERISEPTPKFWRKVRNIATGLVTISSAILVAPVALPASIVTIAGYIAFGGTILGISAQSTSTMR